MWSTLLRRRACGIRGLYGDSHRGARRFSIRGTRWSYAAESATMLWVGSQLPLVARHAELAVLTGAVDCLGDGVGDAVLVTGESGVGKTRLLLEARRHAERSGFLTLRGRAVESGGAFRPIVDAFARPAAAMVDDPKLLTVRPTLARILPGWVDSGTILAPMADPAAVLAEALIKLLHQMAPKGAVLIFDDLHWADDDTLSVLAYLADAVEDLPLALLAACRDEPQLPAGLQQLITSRSLRLVPLRRLTQREIVDTLKASDLPELSSNVLSQLVAGIEGLPLVLDEFVRHLREVSSSATELGIKHTSLATAVHLRLNRLDPQTRTVLDAFSVLGEADAPMLATTTGLDADRIAVAIHDGLSSTLIVPATTPLGVAWRHRLIRDAVLSDLLPLERQAIARRAGDYLTGIDRRLSDGELRQAATLFDIAGYPARAAQLLVAAAREAVRAGGLNAAEQYLADAERLAGGMPSTAHEVLIERIDLLSLAGRAGDAYESGMTALRDGQESPGLITATARAAISSELRADAEDLLIRLENASGPETVNLALLRAHCALSDRRPEALELGEHATRLALEQSQYDAACEAWIIVGRAAARTTGTEAAEAAFRNALQLSGTHQLPLWQVRTLAEWGMVDLANGLDPDRFHQARELAVASGMVGVIAHVDTYIGASISMQRGFIAAYPTLLQADTLARQLRLVGLHAQTRAQIAQCLVNADGQPLPGRGPAAASEADDVVAQAVALGRASRLAEWAPCALGLRSWFHGDSTTAIRLFEDGLSAIAHQPKRTPLWGMWALLRTATDTDPEEALESLGGDGPGSNHINRGALAYGRALLALREGQPATDLIAEGDHQLRNTPYIRHLIRTMIAPEMHSKSTGAAQGWLLEADAFCSTAGERALQRRVRQGLIATGAKLPRTTAGTVPPHLARLGITTRETEVLRLVTSGLSNTEIAKRLFLSPRTVETHVSNLLQKTGSTCREELATAEDASAP